MLESEDYMLSFFFQAEDGIRDLTVTGVQTCALPISGATAANTRARFFTQPTPRLLDPGPVSNPIMPGTLKPTRRQSPHHSRRLFPIVGGIALTFLLVFLAPVSVASSTAPQGLPVLNTSQTGPAPTPTATLPSGFRDSIALRGLTEPTAVRFASDGRVFVAEKSGIVKVFNNLTTPTPTVFADLRTNVHNFWDRGLLGLALAPNFPVQPWVYVLYTYDAAIGGTPPRRGTA